MKIDYSKLLGELINNNESEWIEYKLNNSNPEEIGKKISGLSNGACLHNQPHGYLIFGVDDKKIF